MRTLLKTLIQIGISLTFLGVSIVLLNVFQQFYSVPECEVISYQAHEEVLSQTPYVIGRIRKIETNSITISAEFSHFNRWKCKSLQTPYREILGSHSREYTLQIDRHVPVNTIYQDPRSRYIQVGHTPHPQLDPQQIIQFIDDEVPESSSLDSLKYDDRIVAVARTPILKETQFSPELIMIYPRNDIESNVILQLSILLIMLLMFSLFLEMIFIIVLPILPNTSFEIISIMRIVSAIALFSWYLYSHYYG